MDKILFTVLSVALTLLIPFAAFAQSEGHDEGAQIYAERAHAAYAAGRINEAIELYTEAYRLDPHPVLRFNLARTFEASGDLPRARDAYLGVIEDTDIDEVREIASERLDGLLATLAEAGFIPETVTPEQFATSQYVDIRSENQPVDVYIDGVRLGLTPLLSQPIRPGRHEFFFTSARMRPQTRSVVVTSSGPDELLIDLEPVESVGEFIPPPPGRLSVVGPIAGMDVLIDGQAIDLQTPLIDHIVPAGTYTVRLTHPFFHSASEVVRVEPGQRSIVDLSGQVVQYRDELPLARHQRIGNALMPVGAAVLAAGATSAVLALRDSNRFDSRPGDPDRRQWYDRAQREALAADILIPLGVATFTTGLILRIIKGDAMGDSDQRGYQEDLFRFSIAPTRGGGSIGLRGAF